MARGDRYYGKKTFFTDAYLNAAASSLLRRAEADEEGSFYQAMMSLVASAFCIEAYFNRLGADLIQNWQILERKLSPEEKVKFIADHLRLRPDFSKRPYQSLAFVFTLRNLLAHGKPETVRGGWEGGRFDSLQASWEKSCTPTEARKRLADVRAVASELHQASGKGKHPFATLAHGLGRGV